ncbi:MAG TPA: phosphatidylglycerophosphatase A [Haloplasmataceae bacterium]
MNVDYEVLREKAIKMLEDRGVTLADIANITYEIQKQYYDVSFNYCLEHVQNVISKREVINAVITGLTLDILAEQGHIEEPLRSMLMNDYSLYGIDEVLAYSIVNVYGSIGLTNFGYIDKLKIGIVGEIDRIGKEPNKCNTFLDDIVGAIAASAASRIAHTR